MFQYLSSRYQLQLERVHWEPDVHPISEMWTELEELLQHHPAQVMLWEGEPLPVVAPVHGNIAVIRPGLHVFGGDLRKFERAVEIVMGHFAISMCRRPENSRAGMR